MSRAYYGAYHEALCLAQELGYTSALDQGQGVHKQLRSFLSRQANRFQQLHPVVKHLNRLFQNRIVADYKIDDPIYLDEARRSVNRAKEVVSALQNSELRSAGD